MPQAYRVVPYLMSTVVLALIASGVLSRRRPRRHRRFMIGALGADVFLVLYVELSRHAVETASHSTRPIVWVHAGTSVLVLCLYAVLLRLGLLLSRGVRVHRSVHFRVGVLFCALRLCNYVTSFLM
jgi:hypothetical protein